MHPSPLRCAALAWRCSPLLLGSALKLARGRWPEGHPGPHSGRSSRVMHLLTPTLHPSWRMGYWGCCADLQHAAQPRERERERAAKEATGWGGGGGRGVDDCWLGRVVAHTQCVYLCICISCLAQPLHCRLSFSRCNAYKYFERLVL